jgi:hypothetical protein
MADDRFQDTSTDQSAHRRFAASLIRALASGDTCDYLSLSIFKMNRCPPHPPRSSPRGSQGREWGCLGFLLKYNDLCTCRAIWPVHAFGITDIDPPAGWLAASDTYDCACCLHPISPPAGFLVRLPSSRLQSRVLPSLPS